ncbi:hypothetical protein HMPREF1981_03175 [Bacteroides pyogenes F0041]|uniref:Uncharacterized protein n=1 Tax=Bacteroides pyogenes F0041 TaxID=1321819 RepID=U2DNY2_9BACE|nr:hypothetical protein HMPREF1981_03175 [Bacteroides pyogenes F0041]
MHLFGDFETRVVRRRNKTARGQRRRGKAFVDGGNLTVRHIMSTIPREEFRGEELFTVGSQLAAVICPAQGIVPEECALPGGNGIMIRCKKVVEGIDGGTGGVTG